MIARKKELERRTPLGVNVPLKSNKGLETRKGLTARVRLRPRSKRMAILYTERTKFVQDFLRRHPTCEVRWDDQCEIRSVDVNEILPRAQGGGILANDGDERLQFIASCRHCHILLTADPKKAVELGARVFRLNRQ